MLTRRRFVASTSIGLLGTALIRPGDLLAAGRLADTAAGEIARLEKESGGRLGVAVLDPASGLLLGHRADERFPMCSTFKLLAAAAILRRVDEGKEKLDRRIVFGADVLVSHSPITKERVGEPGMTIAELCAATTSISDNAAANLLLHALGGPSGLTAFARSLGDEVTRLDRFETALNEAAPGDPRDTTSPAAMAGDIRTLVLGDALSPGSRQQLTDWLLGNKTGDARIRAGFPAGWRVADRTGSGENGTANDVGVVWPPEKPPVVLTVYLTGTKGSGDQRNATIAGVARAVASALA